MDGRAAAGGGAQPPENFEVLRFIYPLQALLAIENSFPGPVFFFSGRFLFSWFSLFFPGF